VENEMKVKTIIACTLLITFIDLLLTVPAQAQRPQDGYWRNRKGGVMDGNLCRTPFDNKGHVGGFLGYVIEYPIGSGRQYMDAIAPVLVTKMTDNNGQRQAICETAYGIIPSDMSPDGTIAWMYEPLAGFCNPNQLEAAMSDDPYTWPTTWPDKMHDAIDPGWPNAWNGYFGKGVKNADLETYFVIDDDPDEEFDYYPDANDTSRHGMGTQIYIRSLQWNNVLTESHNFWLYEVENEGTHSYDSVYFALYADFKIGGEDEDVAGYNTMLDIAYCYDFDNTGFPGAYSPVSALGYGYLESPDRGYDGIDNDEDLMLDERRDDGIDNDGDWDAYTDKNGNGKYDTGEPLNDDLGADGIGPFDEAYTGADPGEGDGLPTHGEPDFDEKDLDEGDQLGLTGFWAGDYGVRKFNDDDELVYEWCSEQVGFGHDEYYFASNLGVWFHSGPIYHPAKTFQRFSFSLFYADGPDSKSQTEDAVRKKKTVQQIYDANYRFAQPPNPPKLTAIPGDGKVYLYWDDAAERSYDRFFGLYDFEGYSLYRSTDPKFRDARIITDGFGALSMKKPIFRCDKVDSVSGFFPGTYNGVQFYIGENTGLAHSYIDEGVINGQTYYYALCSFDYGYVPKDAKTITALQQQTVLPSESTISINIDVLNDIQSIGQNCAVVVPTPAAAGYTPPQIQEGVQHLGPQSTTKIDYNIFNPNELDSDGKYRLEFDYPDSGWGDMPYYRLLNIKNRAQPVEIQPWTLFEQLSADSRYFDGLVLSMEMNKSLNPLLQAWKKGSKCNMQVLFAPPEDQTFAVNWDFDLVFTEDFSDTSISVSRYTQAIPTKFYLYSPTMQKNIDYAVVDNKGDLKWQVEDDIRVVIGLRRGTQPARGSGKYQYSWRFHLVIPPDDTTGMVRPQPGDVYQVRMNVPPQLGEAFKFSTTTPRIDRTKAKNELDKITVVPNPYVVTERWEPSSPYLSGRGTMAIHFTHLPQNCTIKIFTVQGYLVDTFEHHSEMYEGTESWDVISKDNMQIAPGNYIYHIDAPGIGEKVGRFMVIK